MVIFDLICLNGHRFEGWFADLTDLEAQLADGRLTCPVCGDENVTRRPSTFGLVRSRPSPPRERTFGQPKGSKAEGASAEELAALRAFKTLAELTDRLEKDFVDVGAGFATEALKIRYGVTPARNIRGHSTANEEETLKSEGVEFFKLPMLTRKSPVS
jgi:hypothetical protein